MKTLSIVITTTDNKENADKITAHILDKKLAACIQRDTITSSYFWDHKICHDEEIRLIFKTPSQLVNSLMEEIKKIHNYETPEIIAFEVSNSSLDYASWAYEVCDVK